MTASAICKYMLSTIKVNKGVFQVLQVVDNAGFTTYTLSAQQDFSARYKSIQLQLVTAFFILYALTLNPSLCLSQEVIHRDVQVSPTVSTGYPRHNANYVKLTKFTKSTKLQVRLDIVAEIESGGNVRSSGDGGRSLGLFQLSKWPVIEYNQANHTTYRHKDALNPITAQVIANWYLHSRIPQMLGNRDSVRNRIIAYNCGISCIDRASLPVTTRNYLKKYQDMGGTL